MRTESNVIVITDRVLMVVSWKMEEGIGPLSLLPLKLLRSISLVKANRCKRRFACNFTIVLR